jgi:anti-sigma factor ChrR (cupin superfamily)
VHTFTIENETNNIMIHPSDEEAAAVPDAESFGDRLFVDPVTTTITFLVRVAAGAVYPAHIHRGSEQLYVLDGDIVFDDHTLTTGDYEVRSPDSRHSSATTAPGEDCLLLVISSGRDEFLP